MAKQIKVAPAPAEVKPAPAPAPAPAPKVVWREENRPLEVASVASTEKASANDHEYILSRRNKVDDGTLWFLMLKLKPYNGFSQDWKLLNSKYRENPAAFVLDTSKPHISNGEACAHHTLHYNYWGDKWNHYHLYYKMENNKAVYTHATTLDAFMKPMTIASWRV